MKRTGTTLLILVLVSFLASSVEAASEPGPPIAIAIHAGAGTISKGDMTAEEESAIRAALQNAVRAGYTVLQDGGSSLDAVTTAVTLLEDSPYFNAGRGAVFNAQGENELDASVMHGSGLEAGAVAAVHNIRNPVLLARKVMTDSKHVMLIGEGAETFAREHGIAFESDEYFFTERRWQQLMKARADTANGSIIANPDRWFSTVGAVAVDTRGNLAAATSTGGMTNKRWGRVGDAPIIGAGTYADNRSCAVSATGHGEYFIRATVAKDICARVQYQGRSLQEAADTVINRELVDMGASGGIIAIDPAGNIALTFNTPGMYRASVDREGQVYVGVYRDE
jgi:beta-aspartyl-peptidase (threonine type)